MSWKILRRWFKQPARPLSQDGHWRRHLRVEEFEGRLCPSSIPPTVNANAADLPITANTLIITGSDFATHPGQDKVAFNLGAVGHVTAATSSQLTVVFTTHPNNVGDLTAVVTAQGVSSGAVVQVATMTPVVKAATSNLTINATKMVIKGSGFSTTPGNDAVTFSDGATGTVTAASKTQLTVSDLSGLTVGPLTASVTVAGLSSGPEVNVATVIPVVTPGTTSLSATADTLTINGFGFSTTPSDDVVTFNHGATGTVTAATATQLTVSNLSGQIGGILTASVTVAGYSSGAKVQVGTVTPVVTSSTTDLGGNFGRVIIDGFGFAPTAGNNTVKFNNGTTGKVIAATATQLTVGGLTGLTAGALDAVVTSNHQSSGAAVQVATVTPWVNTRTGNITVNANTLVIKGFGFSTTPSNDLVNFSNGATGTVTAATKTQLTVSGLSGLTVGPLTVSVTVLGLSSGSAVQVATVIPVVTPSTGSLVATADGMVINGLGFSTTASDDVVTFSNGATGTVTAASSTQLTVSDLSGLIAGNLKASVTVSGYSSGAMKQVANVTPVVTGSTAGLASNDPHLIIDGFGFAPTAGNNTVKFSNGTTGKVIAATATQLIVGNLSGLTAGALDAVVTSNHQSSGSPVQVATVIPVVTATTTNLSANAGSLLIKGSGFSLTPGNDVVTFSNGATGIVTAASKTQLTVSDLTGLPVGPLTASVSVLGYSSGPAMEVATVLPVVTPTTAYLPMGVNYVFINGAGFSTNLANDFVTFNNGVTGTVLVATPTQLVVGSLSGSGARPAASLGDGDGLRHRQTGRCRDDSVTPPGNSFFHCQLLRALLSKRSQQFAFVHRIMTVA